MSNRIKTGVTKRYLLLVSLLAVVWAGGSVVSVVNATWLAPSPPTAADTGGQSAASRRSAPLPFEPNAGQADPAIRFVARPRAGTLYFTTSGVDMAFRTAAGTDRSATANSIERASTTSGESSDSDVELAASESREEQGARMHLRFRDANPGAAVRGGTLLPGKANYLVGKDASKWRTNLDTYSSIVYEELYPGVMLVYSATASEIDASYTIAAGSDPARIRWSTEGANTGIQGSGGIRILPTAPGDGRATAGAIELAGQAPAAWQSAGDGRQRVSARYRLEKDGTVGLELGKYDPSRPLTVTSRLEFVAAPHARAAAAPAGVRKSNVESRKSNVEAGAASGSSVVPPRGAAPELNAQDALATAGRAAGPAVLTPTILGPFPQVVSRPLRYIPYAAWPGSGEREDAEKEEKERRQAPPGAIGGTPPLDPIVQNWSGPEQMPAPIEWFDGIRSGNPTNGPQVPDANGEIGPRHYIQYVNLAFRIYNRDGTRLYPPEGQPAAPGNVLWRDAMPGSVCGSYNRVDPIVQYDQLADRWLMSQLASAVDSGGHEIAPYYQCIAVSSGPDPTDSWYVSEVLMSDTKFNDYPKFGVWPDAYYMSILEFDGERQDGPAAVAFDRAAMLGGQPYLGVKFDLGPEVNLLLPADLDGDLLPPPGAPNVFATFQGTNSLDLYHFSVNWANPIASTLAGPTTLQVAPFDPNMCVYAGCVRQAGTNVRLEALSDRPMYRLAYRNMGSHESLLLNHTVDADGTDHAGIRWYEIRDPNGGPVIWQEGTYAPDGKDRWLGSIAMDHVGNIALGYSLAGGSGANPLAPSIAYAGRLVTDTLGTLPQSEVIMKAGSGVQTGLERWGDYSSLSVDPVDDCTFWYTNEYYDVTSATGWRTHIGSFKFPSCGAVYSTYQGGTQDDGATTIALDGGGQSQYLYVVGETFSADFYTPTNAYQGASAGGRDAVISKLGPDGELLYSTYLGGSGTDSGAGIAVDGAGNIYVTGSTTSADFPVHNEITATKSGGYDAFVTKLDAAGGQLLYSTYLGGSGDDWGQRIAVGGAGVAYVGGNTSSTNFITTTNALQGSYGGGYSDLFAAKLNTQGAGRASVSYATYAGGASKDWLYGLAVDGAGNAHLTGYTFSANFPTANALQGACGGCPSLNDAFVMKLNGTGTGLAYSTYLGGSGTDQGGDIALDGAGNAFINGVTSSWNFPVAGALQGSKRGGYDTFVSKIGATGAELIYSTYLGGNGEEVGRGVAVDGAGNAYVAGYTGSTDFYTVTTGTGEGPRSLQMTNHGENDAYAAKLGPDGSVLLYSTYLGGGRGGQSAGEVDDYANDIAADGAGAMYIAGETRALDFAVSSAYEGRLHPFQRESAGGSDGFMAKVKLNGAASGPVPGGCEGPGADYAIREGMGETIEPGGKTLVAGSQCEECMVAITLPFSFNLYDAPFTQARAGSDGNLQFASGVISGSNSCLIVPQMSYAIMPYWDDLDMQVGMTTTFETGIYTRTGGTAPNRTFYIEWRGCPFLFGSCTERVNFEVRMHEGEERFEVVYGSVAGSGESATVGVQHGNGANSRYTQYSCDSPLLRPGLRLTFDFPPCLTPTPTSTPRPSNTPTATRTRTPSRTPTVTPTISSTRTRTSTRTVTPSTPLPTWTATITRTPCPACPTDTPTSTPCPAQWRQANSPAVGSRDNVLNAVAAVGPSDVWAAGHYYNGVALQTLIVHWDGSGWTLVPSPNPGPYSNSLKGIAAIAPDDIWAVGYSNHPNIGGQLQSLVLHWDGGAWSGVPSPNAAGTNYLTAVAGVASDDVWAVGYSNYEGAWRTLTMHWDGVAWGIIPSPNLTTNNNRLLSVTALASDDVWAVGEHYSASAGSVTLAMHWDGAEWSIVPSPNNPYGGGFQSVSSVSPNDIWALGYSLTAHWDGNAWAAVPTPVPPVGTGYQFVAVSAISANDVWAVGTENNQGLTMHWNGSAWSNVIPVRPGYRSYPAAVSAAGANDVWMVGSYQPVGGGQRPLIEHYSGECLAPTPTPSPVPTCGPGSDYAVTQATGAALVPGTTLVPGTQCFDCDVRIDLPFTYNLYGQNFNSVRVDSSGALGFSGTAFSTDNVCLPSTNILAPVEYAILAHWDNLNSSPISPTLGIYTSTTGVAPNRIFNIEWRSCRYASGQCGYVNFEARLYEGQSRFDLVYGEVAGGGSGATIGVQRDQGGSQYTQVSCNTASISLGLRLTFSQGPACPTSTATSTSTRTATPTWTYTPTRTATPCPSCPTSTGTATATSTGTATATSTRTPTRTFTPCPACPTATQTHTATLTPTHTLTATRTETPTITSTPTPVPSCGPGSNYTVTQSTGASIVPGTQDIGLHCDTCQGSITLPFTYYFYGQAFNTLAVDVNGALFAGGSGNGNNVCLPYVGLNNAIYVHWDDLLTTRNGDGVYTSVTGSAPNRVFNIEWRACRSNGSGGCAGGSTVNFEVRLYEGTAGRLEMVYGQVSNGGSGATVGVQRGTGQLYTQFSCNTASLSGGLQLTFSEPLCATPTGTPPTATSTFTATRTRTATRTPTATPTPAACGVGADYVVARSSGASLVPGTSFEGSCTLDCEFTIYLPFTYYLYGQPFDSVIAGDNGNLGFVASGNSRYSSCAPSRNFNYAIYPNWTDLFMSAGEEGIYTSVTGSAPNRVFNIEWRAHMPCIGCAGEAVNFEVRLYEGQTRFDIVYGQVGIAGTVGGVGVQRDAGTQYTSYACGMGGFTNGTLLSFTQPQCPTLTPTVTPTVCPGCATSTASVTRTVTATPTQACGTGSDYVVTQTTGAVMVPGTTAVATPVCDDCPAVPVTLPFTYYLYGEPFDVANVSENGTVQFMSNDGTGSNGCLPYAFQTYSIFALWDELRVDTSYCPSGCGIFTSVSGAAPNRIFNMEWRAVQSFGGPVTNFEVRLYEGQDRFDVVYGSVPWSGGFGATVGVQRDNGASYTQVQCNGAGFAAGTQLTFVSPICVTPTATGTATHTRTPTVTATATATATPHLVGHVLWQGPPAQPHVRQQLPVTITLKLGTLEVNYPVRTTDAGGFFTVPVGSLLPGTYDWRVKGPKYLANSGSVTLSGGATSVEMGLMRVGDANNDNLVNSLDFTIVRASMGKTVGDPGYDDRADLNGDSVVNTTDFSLLRGNLGLGGAPPSGPAGDRGSPPNHALDGRSGRAVYGRGR